MSAVSELQGFTCQATLTRCRRKAAAGGAAPTARSLPNPTNLHKRCDVAESMKIFVRGRAHKFAPIKFGAGTPYEGFCAARQRMLYAYMNWLLTNPQDADVDEEIEGTLSTMRQMNAWEGTP